MEKYTTRSMQYLTFCTKYSSWNDVGKNYDARPPLELSSDHRFMKVNVGNFGSNPKKMDCVGS